MEGETRSAKLFMKAFGCQWSCRIVGLTICLVRPDWFGTETCRMTGNCMAQQALS